MENYEEFLTANRRYAQDFDHGDLPMPPARHVAVVTCMDARLHPEKFLGLAACRREHPSPGMHAPLACFAVLLYVLVSIQPAGRDVSTWVSAPSEPLQMSSYQLLT